MQATIFFTELQAAKFAAKFGRRWRIHEASHRQWAERLDKSETAAVTIVYKQGIPKKKGSINPLHAFRQEIQLYVNYFPVSMQLGKWEISIKVDFNMVDQDNVYLA